ncbi:uncharacterized protein SPSK_02424 [Sporothrix schenckii 1099-18]|uniref:Uncharacterized protein n=1 Tax=Sporothrix schenckii 1099-18 TaxID=1397361 RepID=A0A0F2M8W0_SPOSC|nr:uncharacterized protein SPSK_02424 [Sporothrix schenckii 1099-18]KJR86138.1 hypothetical protein SPSK_02424 [Sporothrix schenckii 1099-18]
MPATTRQGKFPYGVVPFLFYSTSALGRPLLTRSAQCDENEPCAHCVRRKEQCRRLSVKDTKTKTHDDHEAPDARLNIGPSLASPRLENDPDPHVNLWHLELFHHFAQRTVATLSFPAVWPTLLQQSFHDECIMWAILCTASCHLAALAPQDPRYAGPSPASLPFLPKAIGLFRQNLARPFTKSNADALMGCALLMNYIAWTNLTFLDGDGNASGGLDLSHDPLFLLSPGVRHVYTQAMPIFMAEQSVFLTIAHEHPRRNIEAALARHGHDPTRFVEPFMRCWDSPEFQECRGPDGVASAQSSSTTSTSSTSSPAMRPSRTSTSWLLFTEFEYELAWERIAKLLTTSSTANNTRDTPPETTTDGSNTKSLCQCPLQKFKTLFMMPADPQPEPVPVAPMELVDPQQTAARTGYERVACCLSPLLCCAALSASGLSSSAKGDDAWWCTADSRRLFFTIPLLCSGPFLQPIVQGDARALLLLFHFYRAARIVMAATEEAWWARERSRVMEDRIGTELRKRGFTACLVRE